MGLEGIVSKRLGSTYRSGRSPDWLKFKNPEAPAVKREAEEDWGRRGVAMPVLTLRRIRQDRFVVTGPDIEPVTFKTRAEARDWCLEHVQGSPNPGSGQEWLPRLGETKESIAPAVQKLGLRSARLGNQ